MSRAILPLLLLASATLSAGDPAKDLPKFQGDLQKYWTDACARCHGVNGNGRDNSGKPLPDAGFDFTDSRKANKKKDSDWVKVTMQGKDKMPAFKDKMSEADAQKMITDIVRKFAAKR
ncbi:MAG TPA: cytochrome c [Geothrix sp.]|uniref:c-type cytochrome n=1 Tax=Geothrix mesophila TaxID=2922723 RepID=UPI001FAC946B|nr:cytochrome c [Geothrix sp. SG198]HJV37253.1 cytochrome c [Geothrix sp.]